MDNPHMIHGLSVGKAGMSWVVCLYCEPEDTHECLECLGTDRDPLPWTELFITARVDSAGPGK